MALLQYKCDPNFLLWIPASSVFYRRNMNHPGRWNTFILQLTVILPLVHHKAVDNSARPWQRPTNFQRFCHTAGWYAWLSDEVELLSWWKLVNRVKFNTHDHEWQHNTFKYWSTGNSGLFKTVDNVVFNCYPGTVCKDSNCFKEKAKDRASTPSRGEQQIFSLVRGGTVLFSVAKSSGLWTCSE